MWGYGGFRKAVVNGGFRSLREAVGGSGVGLSLPTIFRSVRD